MQTVHEIDAALEKTFAPRPLAVIAEEHARALDEFALRGTPEAWNRASDLSAEYQRALGLRPVTVERRTKPDGLGRARYLLRWERDGAPCGQLWHGTRADLIAMLQRAGFAVPTGVP